MKTKPVDPAVQALLDEAGMLPDCAAANALYEQAALRAEALDDLDTAWRARCAVLHSSQAHAAPRFDILFLNLAWCLAMSDRDPGRFPAQSVLWQLKWVATDAPGYARVPRAILPRLVEDMDERFVRAGWGRRAGLHKTVELHLALGEPEAARAAAERWKATPRDRGSDCLACETSSMADLFIALGDDAAAIREARPIIAGRLACATVPHSTFGNLLLPLHRCGERDLARRLFDSGRRLVASLDHGGVNYGPPYAVYAALIGEAEQAVAILRARLPETASLHSDAVRMHCFGHIGEAAEFLARHGREELELPRVPGLVDGPVVGARALAAACRALAAHHAALLDRRNGNDFHSRWVASLVTRWDARPA